MKTIGFANGLRAMSWGSIAVAATSLWALPLAAQALSTQPLSADGGPPARGLIQPVLYGDAPMPGHKRGGGRRHGADKKDVQPGVPAMNGATKEDADKEYKKKYGF